MRPISKKTKDKLLADKFMKTCCLAGETEYNCLGRIEFHHNLIVAGRQSDIPETILPVCNAHHAIADWREVKELLNFIMLRRMSAEQIKGISKAVNYAHRLEYLRKKYE